jgi:hypothetical protein
LTKARRKASNADIKRTIVRILSHGSPNGQDAQNLD